MAKDFLSYFQLKGWDGRWQLSNTSSPHIFLSIVVQADLRLKENLKLKGHAPVGVKLVFNKPFRGHCSRENRFFEILSVKLNAAVWMFNCGSED